MNPINQELTNYRHLISHYETILKINESIKSGEMETDGRPLLTDKDIEKINLKLTSLKEQRDDLLMKEKDYNEVVGGV